MKYSGLLFKNNTKENAVVYTVIANFCECVWSLKTDFIIFFLEGLEKTELFQFWIDSFTDFSIHAVKHGIDNYKKSKIEKSFEMVMLPLTLYNDDWK